MPLAEYLASEQAREDVYAVIGVRGVIVRPWGSLSEIRDDGVAWMQIRFQAGASVFTAYYRPDEDRYVVTDLGEGWRQHRLRTGRVDWTAEIIAACDYNPHIVDTGERATAGDCEKLILKASDLPDAICRVMLASLRVAQS